MSLPGSPKAVLVPAENGLDHATIVDAPDGPAGMTWVGDSPWIDTADEFGSYVEGALPCKPAWLVDPTPGLSGVLTVTRSAINTASGVSTGITIWLHDTDILTAVGSDVEDDALDVGRTFQLDGWALTSVTFDVTPAISAAAAAGRLIVVALVGLDVALSMLTVTGGARFIPLRQFHRDDGYGTTPPRAFGGASRIRTGRAYGYD